MRNYNEMKKEEKIKEAWGDKYSNDVIMEGRRCGFKIVDNIEYIVNYQGGDWYCEPHTFETTAFMPKGLRKYLKNNGWIKIESESDLPKEGELFWVIKTGYDYPLFEPMYHDDGEYWLQWYTHYQPIEKPKPPLY